MFIYIYYKCLGQNFVSDYGRFSSYTIQEKIYMGIYITGKIHIDDREKSLKKNDWSFNTIRDK